VGAEVSAIRVLIARDHHDAVWWLREHPETKREDLRALVFTTDRESMFRMYGLALTPGAIAVTELAEDGLHFHEVLREARFRVGRLE
jgi:hypothetical protein